MKLYLAPIQGMTTALQRNIYTQLFDGIDACYAPFIATSHMRKRRSPLFQDILPENNGPCPLVPQILSNNSDDFIFFSKVIADMGYEEINWNIGCPFPMLTKKRKGSGILPYPEAIDAFLDDVCKNLSYKLTVKMRLGLNNPGEGLKVMEVLNKYPLHAVILHSRTGSQRYNGKVDLDAFEAHRDVCQHKLIYNGDIFTKDDFLRIQKRFPEIDRFMLGRGALRFPFLASEIKGFTYTVEDKVRRFKAYHDAVYDHYTEDIEDLQIRFSKMKEFWVYAAHSVDETGDFLRTIRQCHSRSEYEDACNRMFDTLTL